MAPFILQWTSLLTLAWLLEFTPTSGFLTKLPSFQSLIHGTSLFPTISRQTVCFARHGGAYRKKIVIKEWVKHFKGHIIYDNGTVTLEPFKKKQKGISFEESLKEKPKKKFALFIESGENGDEVGSCHRAQFLRMILAHKNLDYKLVPQPLEDRPLWMRDMCPNGEPCLMHDGDVFNDPILIARHIEFFYPDPSLDAEVPVIQELFINLYTYALDYFVNQSPKEDEQKKKTVVNELARLNEYIKSIIKKDGSCYIRGGAKLGISDCALAPLLHHLQVAGKHLKQFEIPLELEYVSKYKNFICSKRLFEIINIPEETIIWGWLDKIKKGHPGVEKERIERVIDPPTMVTQVDQVEAGVIGFPKGYEHLASDPRFQPLPKGQKWQFEDEEEKKNETKADVEVVAAEVAS